MSGITRYLVLSTDCLTMRSRPYKRSFMVTLLMGLRSGLPFKQYTRSVSVLRKFPFAKHTYVSFLQQRAESFPIR